MTTATLHSPTLTRDHGASTMWWSACLVITLAMFVNEHDFGISRYDGYVRPSERIEATAGGGNLARRGASIALAGIGAALLLFGPRQRLRINLALVLPILAGLAWCLVSISWSVDSSMCSRRLIVLGCYLLCAVGLAATGSPEQVARWCVWVGLGSLLLGLGTELLLGTFRPWAGEYRFAGTLHPNAQGAFLTAAAIAAWMLADIDGAGKKKWIWCFALLTIFVALTKSRTSLAGLGVAIACIVLMRTTISRKLLGGLSVAWIAAFGLLVALFSGFDPQSAFVDAALLGRKEQAESLTGRSEIWEEILYYVSQRPWAGYGYESFWTEDHIRRISDNIYFTILSAHSGYLELILSVGIIGLVLFFAAILIGLAQSASLVARPDGKRYALLLGLLVFTLVCSAMESTMVTPNSTVLVLAVTLAQLALFAHDPRHTRLSAASR